MEVAITKIAQNGQVVIPAEIRRKARIKSAGKFIIYYNGSEIRLKPIENNRFMEEMELLSRIRMAEDDVKAGRVTIGDSGMATKDLIALLKK